MTDAHQPEMDGMPTQTPKVHLAGTPAAPEATIFNDLKASDVGRKVLIVVEAEITEALGVVKQKQGTRPVVRLNAQRLAQVEFAPTD